MKRYPARATNLALVLALASAAWACGGRDEAEVETQPGAEVTTEAVRVTVVDLGNAIGTDKRVTDANNADDFRPTDTIYASVATEGTASGATLTARWTYQDGQVVDETSQTISPTGQAVTEFHIAKPDGFPTGNYQVEILLNGRSVEKKDFEVK
jgi:hypothetical protein